MRGGRGWTRRWAAGPLLRSPSAYDAARASDWGATLVDAPMLVAAIVAQRDAVSAAPLLALLARWIRGETPQALAITDRRWRPGLPRLAVEDLSTLRPIFEERDGWTLAAVLASHRDGYVRELATRWLGEVETGDELPFLVLRANDWVEPRASFYWRGWRPHARRSWCLISMRSRCCASRVAHRTPTSWRRSACSPSRPRT